MNIAVIGLGLIGGSVLRALAASGHRVTGFDADPATRAAAREHAAEANPADGRWLVADSITAAVNGADLTVLAVPLPALPTILTELSAAGHAGLITDVTSVKAPVQELVDKHLPAAARFVGGHPMAGRETSGFAAADPELFTGCAWVLCLAPCENGAASKDWLTLAELVTSMGARVVPATAVEHDRAVAAVSHVPHLLATALATAVGDDPLAAALAAGSFRDGTRVAGSRPELVAAMCGGNAAAVGPALDAVLHTLGALRAALDAPAPVDAVRALLGPGHAARNGWPPVAGEPVELAATRDALLGLGRAGGWVTAVAADHRTVTAIRPKTAIEDQN